MPRAGAHVTPPIGWIKRSAILACFWDRLLSGRINLKHWPQWLTWDRDLLTDGGGDDDDDDEGEEEEEDGEDAMT